MTFGPGIRVRRMNLRASEIYSDIPRPRRNSHTMSGVPLIFRKLFFIMFPQNLQARRGERAAQRNARQEAAATN